MVRSRFRAWLLRGGPLQEDWEGRVSESDLVGSRGGRRAPDLLERPAQAVYHLIMDEKPNLGSGDSPPPPPVDDGGDRRPEPEPLLIGLMGFMVGFAGVTALRYASALVKMLK